MASLQGARDAPRDARRQTTQEKCHGRIFHRSRLCVPPHRQARAFMAKEETDIPDFGSIPSMTPDVSPAGRRGRSQPREVVEEIQRARSPLDGRARGADVARPR